MRVRADDIAMRTTNGLPDDGWAQVVGGYGRDPSAALSSLRFAAAAAASDRVRDDQDGMPQRRWEVVGVRLCAGEVPSVLRVTHEMTKPRDPEARFATIAGWASWGTLREVPARDPGTSRGCEGSLAVSAG